jgi:hypothetical protein
MSLIVSYHSNLILKIKTKPRIPFSYFLFLISYFLFLIYFCEVLFLSQIFVFSISQIGPVIFDFGKMFLFKKSKKRELREKKQGEERELRGKKRTEKKGILG